MKAGTIINLDDNVTLKVVLNLPQILNQEDSCDGCYFNEWERGYCGVHRAKHPLLPKTCANSNGDVDKQIIYVKEESEP